MLFLAYTFAFFPSATSIAGRFSRVHAAAAVGASILCACLCSITLITASVYKMRRSTALVLAGFFALLIKFGFIVQEDYLVDWRNVRAFWTDVITLCPDLTDGTVILTEGNVLNQAGDDKFMGGIGYTDVASVFDQIYQFPESWKKPPVMARLTSEWNQEIQFDNNLLKLGSVTLEGINQSVDSSKLIFLAGTNGRLTRRTQPLTIHQQIFPVQKIGRAEEVSLKKGSLYHFLFDPLNEVSDYLTPLPSVGYSPLIK
jgi:hypothetical protein